MTSNSEVQAVRERLCSAFHETTLNKSLASVRTRLSPSGYFAESVTGAYEGMFPRTLSALVRLLLLCDGGAKECEKLLAYTLRVTTGNGLDWFPHVIAGPATAVTHGDVPQVIDELPQADGIANVLLAWALLAQSRGRTSFEDETYETCATIQDRLVRGPFLSPPHHWHWRCDPGLVLNPHLEHSREWQFWHAYDFLTQSFVISALQKMIAVAERREDSKRVERWKPLAASLTQNVHSQLVTEQWGVKTYLEMLLPTGRTPAPFAGLSWINLASIPADWDGTDQEILRNTIHEWRRRARIDWDGPAVTACDWTPEGHTGETYGKMLGWELVYLAKEEDWEAVGGILDFLQTVNGREIYGEIFRYGDGRYGKAFNPDAADACWHVRDRGNGEQCAWLCWAMLKLRQRCGLSPIPPEPSCGE